ncbi:MAG: PAS domain S-box protein, partial [Candidatus Bipolaricaulota bacterium]
MVYSDPRRSDEVPEVSFKTLAETSPVSIVTLDGEGKITYANRRAEEVLGLDKGEITDRTYDDPDWEITDLDGDPYPTRRLPFSKVKRTREPAYDEKLAIEGPGGERRLLSIDASPLFDESGEFDGVIGVVRNITSQANAKSGSTRSKNLYEQLVETMN